LDLDRMLYKGPMSLQGLDGLIQGSDLRRNAE
jgi:hypothetical protein